MKDNNSGAAELSDGQDTENSEQLTSGATGPSRFLELPGELRNMIVEYCISLNPTKNASSITKVNGLFRELWTHNLCKTVGPVRIDGHVNTSLLRFLNQERHKANTESLTIYYDAEPMRHRLHKNALHQSLDGLLGTYFEQAHLLRTLVVHSGNKVDRYFQQAYYKLVTRLPSLHTLVIPTTKYLGHTLSNPADSATQSPFAAVVRTRSDNISRTLYLRFNGYVDTASKFLSRPGHIIDEVVLFGHNASPRTWGNALYLSGLGNRMGARKVDLHRLEGPQMEELKLGGTVECLRICNPRDDWLDEEHLREFFTDFISNKESSGKTQLKELHLVSDVTDKEEDVLWVPESLLTDILDKTTGLWALSIHQQTTVPYNIWTAAHVQSSTLRALSLRQRESARVPAALSYAELEEIPQQLPDLQGLALDMPLFSDLLYTNDYENKCRRNFKIHDKKFWKSVRVLPIEVVLIFVETPEEEWSSEEHAQNMVDLFGIALEDFLGEADIPSLKTVHFVFRDITAESMPEALSKEEITWSFRITDTTVTKTPVVLEELDTDDQAMYAALCGRREIAEEQVERQELSGLFYSSEKQRSVEEQERGKAWAEHEKQEKRRERGLFDPWVALDDDSPDEHIDKKPRH